MDHDHARHQQQEILDRVLNRLQPDSDVLALALIGSFASGEQDAFSDIDLMCYLRDEERRCRETLYTDIADLAPTLWHAWLYDLHALYLYENGVRLDVDFCRPSQTAELLAIPSQVKVFHDPDGVLAALPLAETATPPAEHPRWFQPGEQALVDWFFWMFRQVVCWAQRSAQEGYKAYEKLSNAIDSLAQVRTRLVEMYLWTVGVNDYLKRIDPDFVQRLACTYPRFDAEEVIRCAYRLLDEYERIAPGYCEKSGAAYPVAKVRVIRSLMDDYTGKAG
ncbi:MAG: aminoglycoside 6-adenylyltransferase [Anaerolineae bacterium]|nr:aminoglycoside 6-adenylyltransferase [Anaerolineae bacterium]